MNDDIIVVLDDDNLDAILEEDDMDVHMNEEINIVDIDGADHSKLDNLDYESSGHTGFAPLSILNYIRVNEENEELIIPNMEAIINE